MRKPVQITFVLVLPPLACSLGIAAGGSRLTRTSSGQAGGSGPAASETFVDPPEIVSSKGVLSATLTAGAAMVKIGNKDVLAKVYDGLYIPPTLRVLPGDTIKLKLVNELEDPTNLHYHGLGVSPLGRTDKAFIRLGTGEVFDYEVAIPRNRGAGLYWYHPHQHGLAVSQVGGGMSGGLIIEGILDPEFNEPRLSHNLDLARRLRAVGAKHGRSAGEVAIAWTLHRPAVTGAVVGARSAEQAEGVMRAADFRLSAEEVAEIESEVSLAA